MSTAVAPASVSIPLPVGRLAGIGAVIFAANAGLLVLQLVAGKLLDPFIGSSLETWTSIIGVFLTGIALGNGYGGKLADRYPTPRTLAILLTLGAVAAPWMLLFPMLLNSTGMYKSLPLGPRIPILAAILCLPVGFVLSLLTPLAIKLGLPDVAHTGRVAGLIFALSTLGCLLGNYLTGFYLIPTFTLNMIVVVVTGVLLALAAVSLLVVQPTELTPPTSAANGDAATSVDSPAAPNPRAFADIRQAYLIVYLASFCGMTLEMTASRVLAQTLGVSLFTWTGVIGVMLAGTACGNFTGGLLADWSARSTAKISPRVLLGGTLIMAGAATVLVFVTMAVVSRFGLFDSWEPITQVLGWTFSLFFLPMFMLGLVSPQVIRLSVPDVSHVGRVAGRVYAWSTVGAIIGTFASGYVLLSTFGMYYTLLGVSLILTLICLLVVNIWSDTRAAARADDTTLAYNTAGAGVLLYLFAIVLGGVTGGFILVNRKQGEDVVAIVESNYYTIKVTRPIGQDGLPLDPRNPESQRRSLNLDRLLHSVVDPEDPSYLYYPHEHIQMEFLWLAKVESPEPKTLVIGGGGYTFPRYAMETMPEAKMDVVEIDPKVTYVAKKYLGLKEYPNLHAIHMDGRQFIAEKAAPGSYDLVVQDAVNDFSVPAHLMTKEYNDAVKKSLKPNGVYLLTIIDSISEGKLWRAAMATLKETFPEGNVVLLTDGAPAPSGSQTGENWDRNRHVLVIYASDKPLSVTALWNAAPGQTRFHLATGVAAPVELPGSGPAFTARMPLALYYPVVHTFPLPAERLKQYTDREPGIVLTDQFCPIDNLMAEVFRNRNK